MPIFLTEVTAVKESTEANTGQTLQLIVKEPIKLKISRDKAAWEEKELQPDSYNYSFDEEADLIISDPSSVEILYNGKNLGVFGKAGERKRISFKKTYSPGSNSQRM